MLRYDRIQFTLGLDIEAYERYDSTTNDLVDVVNLDGSPLVLPSEYSYFITVSGEKVE